MRIATTARKALATAAITAALGGTAVLTAGSASATTLAPDSCATKVTGTSGDRLVLSGEAVSTYVKKGAEEARTLLSSLTIWPNSLANTISDADLDVGTVPDARTSTVSGRTIGTTVTEALRGTPGLGALPSTQEKTLRTIENKVSGMCGLSVFAANHAQPPAPKPTAPNSGGPAGQPGSPQQPTAPGTTDAGTLPGSGGATAAPRDYGDIPAVTPPSAELGGPPSLKYPPANGVPGQGSADIGILGHGGGNSSDPTQDGTADIHNAGNADALAAGPSTNSVQLPMLLAVVALAGVTAALVRTWVLRKVA